MAVLVREHQLALATEAAAHRLARDRGTYPGPRLRGGSRRTAAAVLRLPRSVGRHLGASSR